MDQREKQQPDSESLLMRLWSRSKRGRAELEQEQKQDLNETEPEKLDKPDITAAQPAESATAESVMQPAEPVPEQSEPEPMMEQEEIGDPVDAVVQVVLTPDQMTATMRLKEPKFGGADVTEEQIRNILAEKGVVFGIKGPLLAMSVKTRMYGKDLVIARGEPPVNGENGTIEDLFDRNHTIRPTTNQDGTMDFKSLNLIRVIHKGDPICKIVPPTAATPGTNVLGKPVPGQDGKEAQPPKGFKTVLNGDGTALVAECNGNLRFSDGQFRVEEVVHIDSDVDNSVGNIDFCGNVEIKGNVREGFSVRSGGDITIHGLVEGAIVVAKGNITVGKGMNGMDKGVLDAGKDIHCRFLESCSVKAGGSIYADSMMNLTAYAEGSIVLEGSRGVMIGGTYTAQQEIHAKAVGALSNTVTTVILGSSPEVLQEHKRASNQLKELQQELENLEKDLQYLNMKQKANQLTPQQVEMLRQKTKRKTIALMEASRCSKKQEELSERINNTADCKLSCGRIYPRVKLMMRNEVMTIQAQESLRLFYWSEGKICKGSISSLIR